MNGKQSKKLRKLAKLEAVTQMLPYENYEFKEYRKVYYDLTGKAKSFMVYTAFLKDCEKKIYRNLKKEFKHSA